MSSLSITTGSSTATPNNGPDERSMDYLNLTTYFSRDSAGGGAGGGVSLSLSLVSISSNQSSGASSTGESNSSLVEREDIVALTNYVKTFREILTTLKKLFQPVESRASIGLESFRRETLRVQVHERLGEVLKILRLILEKYSPISSTELLMSAGNLIQQVKGYNYEDERADSTNLLEAIDQLALTFSSRVSEYLMGDIDASVNNKARMSPENLVDSGSDLSLSPNDCDIKFLKLPEGIDLALHRAKVWSKYAKDVMTYIEKRTHLEAEHARNFIKLAETMRPVLKEESFLPFQSIYCTALDHDTENSNACLANCALILGHKFLEPLAARRNEHEKNRKAIKQEWQRELKRMHESVNNLRKARALYNQRRQEYLRTKHLSKSNDGLEERTDGTKLDKKKRSEANIRALEAESSYRAAVQEANERCAYVEQVKKKLLMKIRELIYQCDQTMKAVTVSYCQLQHTITAPAPVQFQTLCESSRLYEPGSQYVEFVKRLPAPGLVKSPSVYTFEAFVESDSESGQRQRSVSDEDSVGSADETDNKAGSKETFFQNISSGDELELEFNNSGYGSTKKSPSFTKAAQTHHFRKLKAPSRCRECDTYVCFQGIECSQCGLTAHKKCLQSLAIQCGNKKLPRRMTTFGVHLTSQGDDVPYIVEKCVSEINRRGGSVKGLYRVSGVKSRVEKLCQSFENGADLVDISDVHPNVIANVLKLYLRQLPEPLLTFRFYPDFIRIAKEFPASSRQESGIQSAEKEKIVSELKQVTGKLPPIHYRTLAYLVHHLRRISLNAENNMPPSNLGIVFGPTLLRTSEGGASLSSLVDTVHQTRVIELLIIYATDVFGPSPFGGEPPLATAEEVEEIQPVMRSGKPVDFSSLSKQTTATLGYTSQAVITLAGQKVVTTSASNASKPSIHELRRQFFTAPCSPPQLRTFSTPLTPSSSFVSQAGLSSQSQFQSQHSLAQKTSTTQSAGLTSHEIRSSSSAQTVRLLEPEDSREPKFV